MGTFECASKIDIPSYFSPITSVEEHDGDSFLYVVNHFLLKMGSFTLLKTWF